MRRMWQEIIGDLAIPLIVGLVLALASGRHEDRRQRQAIITPTYDALQEHLSAEQEARDRLRIDLSTLRDERDRLHAELGDWIDWGHDLIRNWEQTRQDPHPPDCPDRSTSS